MHRIRTLPFVVLLLAVPLLLPERGYANVYASHVRFTQEWSNQAFDGSFADGTGAAIRFYLNDAADSVVVEIFPAGGGGTVATLRATGLHGGDNAVLWDGSVDGGGAAPAASYGIRITAYSAGYSTYTPYFYTGNYSIFTRGLTSVNNPLLKNFGFWYTVSGGGYATGVVRHASFGTADGNTLGNPLLTTTGIALGTSERRYSPAADLDGYIYVIGRNDRRIYRFHTDTLDVQLFDSSAYGMLIQGVSVRGSGADKVLYVTGDSAVFRIPIGTESFNSIPPEKIVTVGPDTGKGLVFWDAKVGQDSSLYVIYRSTGAIGTLPANSRGVLKFNLTGLTAAKTLADTVWTSLMADGDPVTLALFDGSTTAASDDILYMSHDIGAPNTVLSGIYAFTNLDAASPTRTLAWADPDNNASSFRSAVATDALGNVAYFENSNEQVLLLAPPSGPNSYTYTALDTLEVTGPGVVLPLITMAEARIDANADRIPDRIGDTVRVIGIINSVNIQTTNFGYFIQDTSGGLEIFKSGLVGAPTLKPGDLVQVIGGIAYFRGTTEITPASLATDVTVLDTGLVVTAIPLTIGQYKANPELYESRRIKLAVANPLDFTAANWPAAGASVSLNIWDGKDTLILRLDSDTEIPGSAYPGFPVTLYGTATQFTSAVSVNDDGYQISPMFNSDFVPVNALPLGNFALIYPPNGGTLQVANAAQTFDFSWHHAIDFNGDALVYQFKPVTFTGSASNNSGADTVKTVTGTTLLGYLGANDSLAFRWTVLVKDAQPTTVACTDTFTVMLRRYTQAPGWTAQTSGTPNRLNTVKIVNPAIAWVGGSGGTVVRTTDAGITWTGVGGGPLGTDDIKAIDALDANTAFVTNSPSGRPTYIYRTTNAGSTWDSVFVLAGGFMDAIHMFNAANGIAIGDPVGGNWVVAMTTDGGATWARTATEPAQAGSESGYVNSFAYVGSAHLWFGSNGSHVYRSTDGGTTWQSGDIGVVSVRGIAFADTSHGVAVGSDGTGQHIFTTADGGATWNPVTPLSTAALSAVATAGGTDFWVTADSSVLRSTDRGATWAPEFKAGAALRHLSVIKTGSSGYGWAVGGSGTIVGGVFPTLTGVEARQSETPESFALMQNFPNPFNPSTTIRYALPKAASVRIVVYSTLGQVVAVLQDGQQAPGTYNAVWNGRNSGGTQVASGVYFYRLEARPADGGAPFVNLKKMILLK